MLDKSDISSNVENVISTLSNESRLSILFKLNQKEEKISNLAKILELNVQDTHRNVNRMISSKILKKNMDGFLQLTPLGKISILLFPSFNFVVKNMTYFQDHTFNVLPEKFAQRIGVLNTCELTIGVVKVLEKWKELIQQSNKYVKVIASQAPLEAVEATLQKANQGLKINLILGKNTIFPEMYPTLLKKYHVGKLELNGFFETKMIEEVGFCIVLSDKEASISFPRLEGDVDIDQTFFGKNDSFLEWCNDLFDSIWLKGNITDAYLGQKFKIL
jgi:predicted transcriptional regulator